MKKDVNELKKMVFDLLQNPAAVNQAAGLFSQDLKELQSAPSASTTILPSPAPVIIQGHNQDAIHQHEDVEESLSIMDKEKELIIKALKKHRGKRKDASLDLGISERTLYRKLKEYDIEDL
jgi:hypothetical protein